MVRGVVVKNSTGNGEAKELIYATHARELRGKMWEGGGCRAEWGKRGEKNWDNYNTTINKIYLKKKKFIWFFSVRWL